MAFTKEQRDALPDSAFAVPGKRKLPIHDATHARLAWDMVDRTSGLTTEERQQAREHILRKAQELGIDTKSWNITASIAFEAMAIAMPVVDGHPNRMPFTGVMTRVDQPSDLAPHGSNGHKTYIPKDVAEAALPSLLGMAVDFTKNLDGHDKKSKIGLITGAEVVGDAVHIEGFFYAIDFPEECALIQAEKDSLGFSYECQARIQDLKADLWVLESCVFTGAALLYKNRAAYQTTSLNAQAEKDKEMDLKEIMEAVTKLAASVEAMGKKVETLQAGGGTPDEKALAAAAASAKIKPHADAIRAVAASMEAAGLGLHATRGHVNTLRHMAASMEADAAMGNVPHIYNDHDYLSRTFEAGADKGKTAAADPEVTKQITALNASIADLGTQLKDLSAKAFTNAPAPDRKTMSPEVIALLAKAGLTDAAKDGKMTVESVDTALSAAGIKGSAAIAAKLKLMHEGHLSPTA